MNQRGKETRFLRKTWFLALQIPRLLRRCNDDLAWSQLLLSLLLSLSLVACNHPRDAVWERVQESGVLRVGMDASFPPFESIAADGALVGFDVELARELGRRLDPALSNVEGVEVEFVANLPYDGLYDALTANRVDVVISALFVRPDKMADFAYSTPYFDAGPVLVVGAAQGELRGLGDLAQHRVATALGTRGDREARKLARRMVGLTVAPYPTAAEALAAVETGEADAALVDHVSALAATRDSDLVIVGEPVVEEPYAVCMRGDSRRLLRAVNGALAEMAADGTLEALVNEWLVESNQSPSATRPKGGFSVES